MLNSLLCVALLAAPITMAGWFASCPQYGDPSCPSSAHPLAVMDAFRGANPHAQQVFLLLSVAAPYLYPLSYLVLGVLALRGAPWFAMAGMICGWIGGIAWGFIGDTMFHIEIFANSDQYLAFATHENNFFSMPYVLAIATGWVLGHLLGYVLLGIALYRARAIPRWASVLLILSAPVMGPVAYGTNIGLIQIAGYIMVLVASIPAAVAVMNRNSLLIELPS